MKLQKKKKEKFVPFVHFFDDDVSLSTIKKQLSTRRYRASLYDMPTIYYFVVMSVTPQSTTSSFYWLSLQNTFLSFLKDLTNDKTVYI